MTQHDFDTGVVARCDTMPEFDVLQRRLPERIKSLEEARAYIREMDMVLLKEKLSDTEGWDPEQAERAERRYKMWLFLRRKYPSELMPPPEDIDKVWHAHLLDSQAYHRDSAAIFGGYFHHYPYFGKRGPADAAKLLDAFENTKRRWKEEYNEDLVGELPTWI
jgi:hypothetical protein